MNIGIIIQARLGSIRLPNKIILDFFNGKNILEIIYGRLISNMYYPVIIATTVNQQDDVLAAFCKNKGIDYYRGSEDDVLDRFINAAEYFKLTHIIRVCSDNPFLYSDGVKKLGDTLLQYPDADYISYKIGGTPSILTHYGFFAELVSLQALYAANKSDDGKAHEHVTNYIYTHNDNFTIKWLTVSKIIEENTSIRLTVDDMNDFVTVQYIYGITGEAFTPESIIEMVNTNMKLKQCMVVQIEKNSK